MCCAEYVPVFALHSSHTHTTLPQALFFLGGRSTGKLVEPTVTVNQQEAGDVRVDLQFTRWHSANTSSAVPLCIPATQLTAANSVCSFTVFEKQPHTGTRAQPLPCVLGRCVCLLCACSDWPDTTHKQALTCMLCLWW